MEVAMVNGQIYMRNMDSVQFTILKGVGRTKWDKKKQMLIGPANLELLDTLRRIIILPTKIEAERNRLRKIQTAIDDQRMDPDAEPLVDYPVKFPLFKHQARGANMALIAFGVVDPPERKHKCATCEHMRFPIGCDLTLRFSEEEMKKMVNEEPAPGIKGGMKVVDCRLYKRKEGDLSDKRRNDNQ